MCIVYVCVYSVRVYECVCMCVCVRVFVCVSVNAHVFVCVAQRGMMDGCLEGACSDGVTTAEGNGVRAGLSHAVHVWKSYCGSET